MTDYNIIHHLEPGTDILEYAERANGDENGYAPSAKVTWLRIMNSPTCPPEYLGTDNDFMYCVIKLDGTGQSWITIKAYDIRHNREFTNSKVGSVDSAFWLGWIDAIPSNPNLIMNPDFSINQRCQTEYSSETSSYVYTADRWFLFKQSAAGKLSSILQPM